MELRLVAAGILVVVGSAVVTGNSIVLSSAVVVSVIVVVSSMAVVVCSGSGASGGRNIRTKINEARMTARNMPMKIAVCLSFLFFRVPPPMLPRSCAQWRQSPAH